MYTVQDFFARNYSARCTNYTKASLCKNVILFTSVLEKSTDIYLSLEMQLEQVVVVVAAYTGAASAADMSGAHASVARLDCPSVRNRRILILWKTREVKGKQGDCANRAGDIFTRCRIKNSICVCPPPSGEASSSNVAFSGLRIYGIIVDGPCDNIQDQNDSVSIKYTYK